MSQAGGAVLPLEEVVQSVNGVTPDASGNVVVSGLGTSTTFPAFSIYREADFAVTPSGTYWPLSSANTELAGSTFTLEAGFRLVVPQDGRYYIAASGGHRNTSGFINDVICSIQTAEGADAATNTFTTKARTTGRTTEIDGQGEPSGVVQTPLIVLDLLAGDKIAVLAQAGLASTMQNVNLTVLGVPATFDFAQGKSAFEVAVDEGFVGNEAAWLASLVGADGADGADGINGTNGTPHSDNKITATKPYFHTCPLPHCFEKLMRKQGWGQRELPPRVLLEIKQIL